MYKTAHTKEQLKKFFNHFKDKPLHYTAAWYNLFITTQKAKDFEDFYQVALSTVYECPQIKSIFQGMLYAYDAEDFARIIQDSGDFMEYGFMFVYNSEDEEIIPLCGSDDLLTKAEFRDEFIDYVIEYYREAIDKANKRLYGVLDESSALFNAEMHEHLLYDQNKV